MLSPRSRFSSPLQVVLLAGGPSPERAVSLNSGAAVQRALTEQGHVVTFVDPAEVDLQRYDWSGCDVVFLALHGTFGEDGQVQQILDDAGIPYTGSGVRASRAAFSKSVSKERFLQRGVSTAPYVLVHASDSPERLYQQAAHIGFPCVVKPDAQGSSLGVSIVHKPAELAAALDLSFSLDPFGLIERAVLGTEWTVGVLDDLTLPVIQIVPARAFYDYSAKYEDDDTQYRFEFDVPGEVVRRIETAARRACQALETKGLARVDVLLDNSGQPWVLEINTIPGMTDHSLVPKAAARAGLSFPELCEQTILSCLPAGQTLRKKSA